MSGREYGVGDEGREKEHRVHTTKRAARAGQLAIYGMVFGQMEMVQVATGIIAISLGLNLLWAVIAIVAGNLLGGIFMAYHSAQGPKLGIPQMIQSRAQFGMIGASLPLALAIVAYIGFFAGGAVLGGGAIARLLHVSTSLGIVVCSVFTLGITVVGYDLVHRYDRIMAFVFAAVFGVLTIKLATSQPQHFSAHGITFGHVFLAMSIFAVALLAYAPYVADYSRYLPESASISRTFWYTYLGAVISSCWMQIVGAMAGVVALKAVSDNPVGYVSGLLGSSLSWLILVVVVLGIMGINAKNLYGCFMSLTTTVTPFANLGSGSSLRAVVSTIACVVGSALAIWGQGNFLGNLENFLVLLLYFMIPWTAINLVDFYFVKRGVYSVSDIFKMDGIYGVINWKTISVYVVAVLVEIPFINSALYVGPVARYLGGADLAWIVSLAVASVLYYLVADRTVPETKPGKEEMILEQTGKTL